MGFVIAAPDQARCPVAIGPLAIVMDGCGRALQIAGDEPLRVGEVPMRKLHRPVRCWRKPDAPAPRIELAKLDVLTSLVRLRAAKDRAFNTEPPRRHARREHAMSDVR